MKEYQEAKQDKQLGLSETFKPIIKAQEETKDTIDKKQDKLLDQLQKNKKAITSGLEDIAMLQQLPEAAQAETSKLPIDYKPAMMEKTPKLQSNMDDGFTADEIQTLMTYNLYAPSDVLLAVKDKNLIMINNLVN